MRLIIDGSNVILHPWIPPIPPRKVPKRNRFSGHRSVRGKLKTKPSAIMMPPKTRWWHGWYWLDMRLNLVASAAKDIVVVYDAYADAPSAFARHMTANCHTEYIRYADARIVDILEEIGGDETSSIVVTSDLELQRLCRQAGASVIASGTFIRLLTRIERLARYIPAEAIREMLIRKERPRMAAVNGKSERVVLSAPVVVLDSGSEDVLLEIHGEPDHEQCVWNVRPGVGDAQGYIVVEDLRQCNRTRERTAAEIAKIKDLREKLKAAQTLEMDEKAAEYKKALAELDDSCEPVFAGAALAEVVEKVLDSGRKVYSVRLSDLKKDEGTRFFFWFQFSRRLPEDKFPALAARAIGPRVYQGPFNPLGALHIVSSGYPLLEERMTSGGDQVVVRFTPDLEDLTVKTEVFGSPMPYDVIEWASGDAVDEEGIYPMAAPLEALNHAATAADNAADPTEAAGKTAEPAEAEKAKPGRGRTPAKTKK